MTISLTNTVVGLTPMCNKNHNGYGCYVDVDESVEYSCKFENYKEKIN
jgi:hypothetical protein